MWVKEIRHQHKPITETEVIDGMRILYKAAICNLT